MTNSLVEEEKKVIAPLLGKLYISPTSSEEKLRALYEEVSSAVEESLLTDATGRNALYKIHVSLGKIVNALGEGDRMSRRSRSASVAHSVISSAGTAVSGETADKTMTDDGDDATIVPRRRSGDGTILEDVEEEDEEDEGDTTVKREEDLVEELLTDDDA